MASKTQSLFYKFKAIVANCIQIVKQFLFATEWLKCQILHRYLQDYGISYINSIGLTY